MVKRDLSYPSMLVLVKQLLTVWNFLVGKVNIEKIKSFFFLYLQYFLWFHLNLVQHEFA